MSQTGAQLLTGFSTFLNDLETSDTSSAGSAGGSTLVDTYLKRYQDDRLEGRFFRITGAGTNQYQVQTASGNSQSSGTVDFNGVFPAAVASVITYEIHRYDPVKKFRALDQAVYDASDHSYILAYNETITADGNSFVFPIPSDIGMGPILVYEETPVSCQNIIWNFISSSIGDSTDPWTQTNCTATVVNIDYTDLVIPKYDYASTKIEVAASTTASYSQPVADMAQSMTAAKAAGRRMTFGMWVYCEEASRVSLSLTDDSGATSSTFHQGLGWELLFLEKVIVGNNATTLTAAVNATSGDALTFSWNRSWLYYGRKEDITECYTDEAFQTVRRDDANQTFMLSRIPQRGHQLRLIGQQTLTPLGTNTATQVTNTMEVTTKTAEMLYAQAAEILYEWEGLNASDVPEIFQRISIIKARMKRVDKFRQQIPTKHVNSAFWA